MCGKDKKPSVRMEVECDLDMYNWHIFFGLPGMPKNTNIMWMSSLLNAVMTGTFPHDFGFKVGSDIFKTLYFLTDGIFPAAY